MIRRLATASLFAAVMAAGAAAQDNPQTTARLAIEKLDAAAQELARAPRARDRVRALTKTVQAYEVGLDAMRAGLRQTAQSERVLAADLSEHNEKLTALLGALLVQQNVPEASVLLHPSGPMATVRAGMLMAEAAPKLEEDAAELRGKLQELQELRALQQAASERLRDGLLGAQDARIALSLAVAERGALPRRFTEDTEAMRALLDSSETLEGFAAALTARPVDLSGSGAASFQRLQGVLPLPVRGETLRRFNQPDAAGIPRPGIIVSTPAQALVTTPADAIVRYRGPLLDFGNVVILEPERGFLLVLAGLSEVFVEAGQAVPAGYALALMGGEAQITQGFDTDFEQDGGNPATETLYIEVREGNRPVDPEKWFRANKD